MVVFVALVMVVMMLFVVLVRVVMMLFVVIVKCYRTEVLVNTTNDEYFIKLSVHRG